MTNLSLNALPVSSTSRQVKVSTLIFQRQKPANGIRKERCKISLSYKNLQHPLQTSAPLPPLRNLLKSRWVTMNHLNGRLKTGQTWLTYRIMRSLSTTSIQMIINFLLLLLLFPIFSSFIHCPFHWCSVHIIICHCLFSYIFDLVSESSTPQLLTSDSR